MSGRWWLGLMAAGLTSTCLIVGCDSNDDDDDNTDDPAPAGNTDTAPVDGAFSGTRADADSTAAIAFNFNQNGEVLTGSLQDAELGNGVVSGDVHGDDLEFTTVQSSGAIIVEWEGQAESNGAKITGAWTIIAGGTNSGSWSVQR